MYVSIIMSSSRWRTLSFQAWLGRSERRRVISKIISSSWSRFFVGGWIILDSSDSPSSQIMTEDYWGLSSFASLSKLFQIILNFISLILRYRILTSLRDWLEVEEKILLTPSAYFFYNYRLSFVEIPIVQIYF